MDFANRFKLKEIRKFNFGILILVVAMLLMTILPLKPFLLDLLFTFNITLSLVILMVCIYVSRPLEFSIFPTILLVTTLLRLTLNIASTRVVLLHGHTGPGAAGEVIRAFGEVVIGGSFVVGMIVFAILMIINFVVVTKGAGRVSEVSARFTLDAMPGKQMSIDADLSSGTITLDEARKRRNEVMQEADFYGSMDGASKFVRGDAIAGLLILFINLIGGIVIGIFQHHMVLKMAVKNFSLLTIGDGLVAQIPSLLLSISAAIMVTRVTNEEDISKQTMNQLFSNPKPLLITAVILFVLALIPGMPHLPFLLLAVISMFVTYNLINKQKAANLLANNETSTLDSPRKAEGVDVDWDDVFSADSIALEIGYSLISLVGVNKDGLLINRIKGVRKKLSHELGFLIPAVHVKDNINLSATHYRIYLKNVVIAESEVYPDMNLAINPGHITHALSGIQCLDPTFGLNACWIAADQRQYAQGLGYTVVDASTVVATHLNQLIRKNASHLLGYDEVQQLLNRLMNTRPKLVETLTSSSQGVPLNVLVTVLQRLLQSGIPIIDMRTIAEKTIESWAKSKDIESLVENIRVALKHLIVYSICSNEKELPVAVLDNDLAQILHKSIQQNQEAGDKLVVLEPSLTERIYTKLLEYVRTCEVESMPAIILVTSELRSLLEKLFKPGIPNMHFLSHNEIPDDRRLSVVARIG
ncbi:MAG: flagellar biosynthesis protein FlhA [Gammaproteobacteria bacterium]|nr:flagellar biosynthesis protein FlhA [Gammaproteobacteria bacterium]